MDDNILNPRKRLLSDKETVELVEIIEAAQNKIKGRQETEEELILSAAND